MFVGQVTFPHYWHDRMLEADNRSSTYFDAPLPVAGGKAENLLEPSRTFSNLLEDSRED